MVRTSLLPSPKSRSIPPRFVSTHVNLHCLFDELDECPLQLSMQFPKHSLYWEPGESSNRDFVVPLKLPYRLLFLSSFLILERWSSFLLQNRAFLCIFFFFALGGFPPWAKASYICATINYPSTFVSLWDCNVMAHAFTPSQYNQRNLIFFN